MFISNKTMRARDYAALKAGNPNFKKFKIGKSTLYKTNRGWFVTVFDLSRNGKIAIREISITQAQRLLNDFKIQYSTGW